MQRKLFILNLFLMAFAVLLILLNGWDFLERRTFALGLSRTLPAGAIHVERVSEHELSLRFPVPMVSRDRVGRWLERSPFVLDPPVPLSARWKSEDLLLLKARRSLPRARRFRLTLCSPLSSPEGRKAPEDLEFYVETPSVRLDHVMVLSGDGGKGKEKAQGTEGKAREEEAGIGAVRAVLTFDLPLDAEDLKSHLHAEDMEGRPLSLRVKAVEGSKGRTFEIAFSRADGAAGPASTTGRRRDGRSSG